MTGLTAFASDFMVMELNSQATRIFLVFDLVASRPVPHLAHVYEAKNDRGLRS